MIRRLLGALVITTFRWSNGRQAEKSPRKQVAMVVRTGLEFARGETWRIPIACLDANGQPLDITGGLVQVRMAANGTLVLDKALAANGSGYTTGKAIIVVAIADTSIIAPNLYQYEARSVSADGLTVLDQQIGSIHVRESLFVEFPYTPPGTSENDLDLTSGQTRLSPII